MKVDRVDTNNEILVIAEIGNNHEGSFEHAVGLIKGVALTGAQAVKFQTFITEFYVSPENPARFEQLKRFELSQDTFRELARIAREEGLIFLSTPFDLESARFLNEIVPAFKIGSGENTFYPLLQKVSSFAKPIILSTGCADLDDITKAADTIRDARPSKKHSDDLAILHCVTSYPTKIEDCNLGAVTQLKKSYPNLCIGYSDHTLDMYACLYAAALGARILEKHFTLDKNFSAFHDHKISATPDELAALIERLKDVPTMLGEGEKKPRNCEQEIEDKVRRAICAAHEIPAGTTITSDMLCWTRPKAGGLAPGQESAVLGRKTRAAISKGARILPDNLI